MPYVLSGFDEVNLEIMRGCSVEWTAHSSYIVCMSRCRALASGVVKPMEKLASQHLLPVAFILADFAVLLFEFKICCTASL